MDNIKYVSRLIQNVTTLVSLEKDGFTVKMQLVGIKVIKGSLVFSSGTRRANCIYNLDGTK